MAEIKVREGESLDSALRRFKRQTARDGTLTELRKREHYEKPSVKRKKKSEAARKRKYKYDFLNKKQPILSVAFYFLFCLVCDKLWSFGPLPRFNVART